MIFDEVESHKYCTKWGNRAQGLYSFESYFSWLIFKDSFKFVPIVVSKPLLQSSSQKITLVQGVCFVGVFEAADIMFWVPNTSLFIAISPFRFLDGW